MGLSEDEAPELAHLMTTPLSIGQYPLVPSDKEKGGETAMDLEGQISPENFDVQEVARIDRAATTGLILQGVIEKGLDGKTT